MPEENLGKRKLQGRWLGPGENPFKATNPVNAQRRQELISSSQRRNEELSRLMNERAAKPKKNK